MGKLIFSYWKVGSWKNYNPFWAERTLVHLPLAPSVVVERALYIVDFRRALKAIIERSLGCMSFS